MSEEIALATADLATVTRLQADRDWWQQHAHDTLVELHETQAELEQARIGLAAEQELRARSEMIVLAARRLVSGPDSAAYTTLAAEIDAYDEAMKGRKT